MSHTIQFMTTADAQPWTPVERAKVILAALGDAPDLEATIESAASWLLPPAKPEPVGGSPDTAPGQGSLTTDAERRLASVHSAVPAWLLPPGAA